MRKSYAAAAGLLALATAVATTLPASASTIRLSGADKQCTQTDPEYIIADQGQTISVPQYSYRFTAKADSPAYTSAYLVTGYSRGNNSDWLCGVAGKQSFELPFPVKAGTVSGGMTYRASGSFTRPGWDIWLEPAGDEYTDTTASKMESNPRTVEVLVQPGSARLYQPHGGGHYRAYIGENLKSVNLENVIIMVMAHFGLNRRDYYWEAIDAGEETARTGSFTMESYRLAVTVRATATEHATWTATHTSRKDGKVAHSTAIGHAAATRTVTVDVKPGYNAPAVARAAAYKAAVALAKRYAAKDATVLANAKLKKELQS